MESTPERPDAEELSIPERPDDDEYLRKHWEKMDTLFHRTMGQAENTFKLGVQINLLIVFIGIFILFYSILHSWLNGLDLYSTAFGTIGVISFISTFYLTPQDRIQKTIGDLAQIQMCYRTYLMLWEFSGDWQRDHRKDTTKDITLQELTDLNKQLVNSTIAMTKNIEDIIGKKDSTSSKETET